MSRWSSSLMLLPRLCDQRCCSKSVGKLSLKGFRMRHSDLSFRDFRHRPQSRRGFVGSDPKFFLSLAWRRGGPTDVSFFENYVATRSDGVWKSYRDQQTDVTGCTNFANDELVKRYSGWIKFQSAHPTRIHPLSRTNWQRSRAKCWKATAHAASEVECFGSLNVSWKRFRLHLSRQECATAFAPSVVRSPLFASTASQDDCRGLQQSR